MVVRDQLRAHIRSDPLLSPLPSSSRPLIPDDVKDDNDNEGSDNSSPPRLDAK